MDAKSQYRVHISVPRIACLLILVLIVAVGCAKVTDQSAANLPEATQTPKPESSATPTDTPEPTDTPAPTATSTATETPEPTSTATPDLTATAVVQATQAAEEIMAKISPVLQIVEISPEGGHLGWQQTQPESFILDTYGEIRYSRFADELKASDFVLSTTITWESTSGLAGCGVMFRSEPDFEEGENYQFATIRLIGNPGWDIEYWKYGEWQRTLTNQVVYSKAIKDEQGSSNEYILVAQADQFTIYANGDRLGAGYDRKLSEGFFAFLAWHESGDTTCTFEDTWVWISK